MPAKRPLKILATNLPRVGNIILQKHHVTTRKIIIGVNMLVAHRFDVTLL
jgi:hypothetical protein